MEVRTEVRFQEAERNRAAATEYRKKAEKLQRAIEKKKAGKVGDDLLFVGPLFSSSLLFFLLTTLFPASRWQGKRPWWHRQRLDLGLKAASRHSNG